MKITKLEDGLQIGDYKLVGGGMCPEQYDVFLNDKEVAYFRLRHGLFRAECPFHGTEVFRSYPEGDGCFDDNERELYLTQAVTAVDKYLQTQK